MPSPVAAVQAEAESSELHTIECRQHDRFKPDKTLTLIGSTEASAKKEQAGDSAFPDSAELQRLKNPFRTAARA